VRPPQPKSVASRSQAAAAAPMQNQAAEALPELEKTSAYQQRCSPPGASAAVPLQPIAAMLASRTASGAKSATLPPPSSSTASTTRAPFTFPARSEKENGGVSPPSAIASSSSSNTATTAAVIASAVIHPTKQVPGFVAAASTPQPLLARRAPVGAAVTVGSRQLAQAPRRGSISAQSNQATAVASTGASSSTSAAARSSGGALVQMQQQQRRQEEMVKSFFARAAAGRGIGGAAPAAAAGSKDATPR
jgi:hypothetical protein